MKNICTIAKNLIAMVLVCWYTIAASAQTVENFDTPADTTDGTLYVSANCNFSENPGAPVPVEFLGGPTGIGNFLRLATILGDDEKAIHNSIAFDVTDPGLFSQIVAEFDFRMTPGPFGKADGFGFALLNTANYGNSGGVCPTLKPNASEEPNFTGSLGVGFDIFQNTGFTDNNDNHLSIHFDSVLVEQFDMTAVDLAGAQWIHAKIIMRPGGGFSDVSVILTPLGGAPVTVLNSFPVPGFNRYEGRVFFGARSGGLSAEHDFDNINVQFSGSPDPAVYGSWSDLIDVQIVSIHMNLLPTGKVLFWSTGGESRLWDPATEKLSTPAQPGYDIFCSGHAFLSDGRLLVSGGHIDVFVGLSNASIYDAHSDTWTPLPAMNAGRWYPTNTTLANGDVLVISGTTIDSLTKNTLPQVWQAKSGTWRDLTNAKNATPLGTIYDLYPRMFLTADGTVFKVGGDKETWYLDTSGSGAWSPGPSSSFGWRDYGSAVMYDEGKILITGGGDPPTSTAEIIDLNVPAPAWQPVDSMAYARRHLNATLLPDGKVLVTSGTASSDFNNATNAVRVAEMWDPETKKWSTMAAMQFPRVYHSTALLLPDGRVFVGGGGEPEPAGHENRRDVEIYSPPYLHRGAQPTITSAPASVTYGQTFSLQTPDVPSITNVNWIRLPSVTHSFDENQRMNKLDFSKASGGINVTAPLSAEVCPPGHYMMFILNVDGVPSVAEIIQIISPDSLEAPFLVFPFDSATGVSTDTVFVWNHSDGAVSYGLQVLTADTLSVPTIDQRGISDTTFTLSALSNETTYSWRVNAVNEIDTSEWSKYWSFTTGATSVEQIGSDIPSEFRLSQNYPNPFNPSTTIEFALPIQTEVILRIYNLSGIEIASLVDDTLPMGKYKTVWDGTSFASGIYFYRIQAGDFVETRKLSLIK